MKMKRLLACFDGFYSFKNVSLGLNKHVLTEAFGDYARLGRISALVFYSEHDTIVRICFLSFTENARDARGFL
ncbi:hypothetical protein Lpp41_03781 [Lacticaseibacillus paracasei subsp. paracasei Lpp41]|uniref:Uncharacterized protein n=1 Tax=Lacticaseibacillus paracasei subsp. paracasei Lpp41 TaxID=1256208 RepID=A0A829H9G6_LACPA|nr:hypothetical protein Lpp41_03781 [Lacticaseibacillus paracasei subsp. paracasei Lpp41]